MFGLNKTPSFGATGTQNQNTGTSAGTGLFSSNTFGNNTQANTPASTGFGGVTGGAFGQTKPQTGGSLFGNKPNATSTTPGLNLFGQNPQAAPGGSLFGASTTKPQAPGGLFNQNQTQAQTQPAQAAPTGGLFGLSGQNQTQSQTQPAQANTSLFGQSNIGTTGGLFGQNRPNTSTFGQFSTQPASTGLFGQSTQPSGSTGFGLSNNTQTAPFFSAAQQQPSTTQLPSNPAINATTRYSSLNANTQKFLDDLDKEIFSQIQLAEELQTKLGTVSELVESVPNDVAEVQRRLSSVSTALLIDSDEIETTKRVVDEDTSNARISSRILDVFKTPGATYPFASNDPLMNYFEQFTENAKKRTDLYAATIGELEQHLEQVETTPQNNSPEALLKTIKEEHKLFMALSNRFAQVHDEVKRLQVNTSTSLPFIS